MKLLHLHPYLMIISGNRLSKDRDIYGVTADGQWWEQLVGIFLCISFAVVMGSLTGLVLSLLAPDNSLDAKVNANSEFHDKQWWSVATDYGRSLYSELAVLMRDEEAGDSLLGAEQALQVLYNHFVPCLS